MFSLLDPKQQLLVTSRGEIELLGRKMVKDNVHALHWRVPLSKEPEMIGIALERSTLSSKLIDVSKVFVVHAIEEYDAVTYRICGRESGITVDKFTEANLTKEEADTVDCPRIAGSAYLECKVVDQLETGDHTLFVGEVMKKNV